MTFSTTPANSVFAVLFYSVLSLCLTVAAFGDDVQSRVDRYFTDRVASKALRVEVLLSRKNQPLVRGQYGKGSRAQTSRRDPQWRFPVGAIAEQFLAAAVLRLEEEGKINLAHSVCEYLQRCEKTWKDIKIVNLLTHTSGLSLPRKLRRSLADSGPSSMEFNPGTVFRNNELDFVILNAVLGEVSGESPQKYIETEFFRPKKMFNTQCCNWRRDTSTLEDLYRWDLALTSGGVISFNSLGQMLTPYRDGYSFGWKILKEFDRKA